MYRFKVDVGTGRLMDLGRHFGGGNTSQTTSSSAPWEGQQPYLTDLFSKAQNYTNGGGITPYTGQTYADQSQNTQQGLSNSVAAANGSIQNDANQGTSAWSNMLNGGMMSASSNPYLQGYMKAADQPIMNNLTQNVLPQISSQAEAQGAYGGSREAMAQTTAVNNANTMAGNINAEIGNNAYNSGLQSMQYALGLTPTMQSTQLLPSQIQTQAGQMQDQYNQGGLTNAEQQYYTAAGIPMENLQNYAKLIGGNYGQQGTSTTSGNNSGQTMSGLGGLIGGAAQLGELFM